ncbi:MAG: S49 family peptidase, partial [Gammaproteobacteria bacterium]|nr:S49 family peptidase [Gammaproteobacteria bacterium]
MSDEKDLNQTEQLENASSSEQSNEAPVESTDPWTQGSGEEKQQTQQQTEETPQKESIAKKKKPKETPDLNKEGWERDLVNRLAFSAINEQRRSRRWNIFFKSAFLLYLLSIFFMYLPEETGELHLGPHTAMVEISGPIADNAFANANSIITGMREAFKDKNSKALILRINSPGGSPVHAGYVYDEIKRLRKKYPDKKLYAVVTDLCASAAYYIASAADEIYADKASIVGSIGVIMDGYGFVDAMKKVGVERRVMTAGKNKAFLDPFSPLKEEQKEHMQGLLDDVHVQFINAVKQGRGDRLKTDYPGIFSGLVWSGDQSVEIGLTDGLGSMSYVAREIIGQEKIVDFTPRPDYFERFADRLGV